MREASPRDTVEQMYTLFMLIYGMAPERGNEAFARQMLEQDIELLGHYFGLLDPIEQQSGLSLLAECLAYLKVKDSPMPLNKVLDSYIEAILTELKSRPATSYGVSPDDPPLELVRHMKTLRISQYLLETGHILQEQDNQLRDGFIRLANFFLLRDGNVTDKEMKAITGFEEQLKRRGYL